MAFFDDLKNRAVDLANAGAAKTKQLTELAKLNLNNASEEDAIKRAYQEIGRLYYEANGVNPDPIYAEQCEKATAAKINIEENNSRIAELKAQPEVSVVDAEPEESGSCGCGAEHAPAEPEAPSEPETPAEPEDPKN